MRYGPIDDQEGRHAVDDAAERDGDREVEAGIAVGAAAPLDRQLYTTVDLRSGAVDFDSRFEAAHRKNCGSSAPID